jgi:O-antigen/teichoic acid export membrane protein
MSLARRSLTSISWNFAVNTAAVGILAVRMILLTRWLTPEIYGVYTFAYAILILTIIIPNFGMEEAFVHRAPEVENESDAAAVHFTLRSLFTLIWAAVILLGTLLFAQDDLRLALLVLTPVYFGVQMTQTPILILRRRVTHRRLAVVRFLQVILTTAVSLPLAWYGAGLWALMAADIVFLVVRIFVLYFWRPVWIPRFKWDPAMVRYYLNFGGRAFAAHALETAIDRVDDLWTGVYLGQAALGIYSRAYTFATYPRQLLAEPLNNVASGMYAELKGDRPGLSSAFFRNNAFLIRAGFLLTGLLFLLAPELIFLLGEQWQDMLIPFRLMLLFVLLDPIRLSASRKDWPGPVSCSWSSCWSACLSWVQRWVSTASRSR